jgi:hypothetical protein
MFKFRGLSFFQHIGIGEGEPDFPALLSKHGSQILSIEDADEKYEKYHPQLKDYAVIKDRWR